MKLKTFFNALTVGTAIVATATAALAASVPTYTSAGGNIRPAQGVTQIQPGTMLSGSSGDVANTNAVATLSPGSATQTVWISGFECSPGGATGAALVAITVVGTLGGTKTYVTGTPAGATIMGTPIREEFVPPLPASAVNTAIVVTMPALGTGNAHASCTAHGFTW